MNAFVDTNVPIAYVYRYEPDNLIAEYIFNIYDEVYWSSNVKKEFDDVIQFKSETLTNFYDQFILKLTNHDSNYFYLNQLYDFAENFHYEDKRERKVILGSIKSVWNFYFPSSDKMDTKVVLDMMYEFRVMLLSNIDDRVLYCEKLLVNTYDIKKRKKAYSELVDLLKSNGAHDKDIIIILDAFDFLDICCLEFITFDKDCYMSVLKSDLDFKGIKTKNDFTNLN